MNEVTKTNLETVVKGLGDSEYKMFHQAGKLVKISEKATHLVDEKREGTTIVTVCSLEIPIIGYEVALGLGHGGSEGILKNLSETMVKVVRDEKEVEVPLVYEWKIFSTEDGASELMSLNLADEVVEYMNGLEIQ